MQNSLHLCSASNASKCLSSVFGQMSSLLSRTDRSTQCSANSWAGWRTSCKRLSQRKSSEIHSKAYLRSHAAPSPSPSPTSFLSQTHIHTHQCRRGWGDASFHMECEVETERGLLNMKVKCERHFSTPHCSMQSFLFSLILSPHPFVLQGSQRENELNLCLSQHHGQLVRNNIYGRKFTPAL